MMEKLPANDHKYADVINRIVTEFDDTPGGAPPGVVVEGIIATQETEHAMSTGTGAWPANDIGWHFRSDSEDMQWFMERRSGATPSTVEEWTWLVANGVDTRQEMGGIFENWRYAAMGLTGTVDPEGVTPGLTDEQAEQGANWMNTFTEHVLKQPGVFRSDLLTAGLDTGEQVPKIENGRLVSVEKEAPIHEQVTDPIGSAVRGLQSALTEWGPRILLFLIGIVVLGIGVWFMVKGKK